MELDRFSIALPTELSMMVSALELYHRAGVQAEWSPDMIAHVRGTLGRAKKLEAEAREYFRKKDEERVKRSLASMRSRMNKLSRPKRTRSRK